MKLILAIFVSLFLSATSYANNLTIAAGAGQESVTKPRKLTVDLYQVGLFYRVYDNYFIGSTLMRGYPQSASSPNENRYELVTGGIYKIGNFMPYVNVAIGQRNFQSSVISDYTYHSLIVGNKYRFSEKIYADLKYRYRNDHEDTVSWRSNLYGSGIGYSFSKTTDIELGYAQTKGDYESTQWGLYLISRY